MRALIIRSEPLELILSGKKRWEIRSAKTQIRERIALIRSGSGLVVGTCDLIGVKGPLTLTQIRWNVRKIGINPNEVGSRPPYRHTYAWLLANPKRFRKPITYRHPAGARIWVRLPDEISKKIQDQNAAIYR
jgi:hypothetical protein